MFNSTSSRRMGSNAPVAANPKQTHKLTQQTCVLWLPDAPGYAASLGCDQFHVVDHPSRACHLSEGEAEHLALQVQAQLGVRAAIRPYYAQPSVIAGSSVSLGGL